MIRFWDLKRKAAELGPRGFKASHGWQSNLYFLK